MKGRTKYLAGRAENENLAGKELFEGGSAISQYHWAAEEGEGTGMIIADRGMGKTFFARKLAREVPMNFYILNKNNLEYELAEELPNPKIVGVDDLHYVLQVMRLGRLENIKTRDEKEVLQILKNFKDEAKEAKAKIIFIADEGPFGLSSNFQEENKKEFLQIIEGCVATGDDAAIFSQYLGKFYGSSDAVYNFRDQIGDYTSVRIRKEFGMKDVPLVAPSMLLKPRAYKYLFNRFVVSSDEPETIERKILKQTHESWEEVWSPSYCCYIYPNLIYPNLANYDCNCDFKYSYRKGRRRCRIKDDKQKLIAPIREFKVLSDEFGEVSRKTLGISFGEREGDRCYYELSDIRHIANAVERKYQEITKRHLLPLARALFYARSENEFRAAFVKHELGKD